MINSRIGKRDIKDYSCFINGTLSLQFCSVFFTVLLSKIMWEFKKILIHFLHVAMFTDGL
jgi:hypothetical protein